MSGYKTFEKLVNFLSLFDHAWISPFSRPKFKFLKFVGVKVIFNAHFFFFLWRRSLVNMFFSRNAPILIVRYHEWFEFHDVLSQSTSFVRKNVLNLTKFFIYWRSCDYWFLAHFNAEKVRIISNKISLKYLDKFKRNNEGYWN